MLESVTTSPFPPEALVLDHYNGITLNLETLMMMMMRMSSSPDNGTTAGLSTEAFQEQLTQALEIWRAESRVAVWIQVPRSLAALVPVCVELGFNFHYIKDSCILVLSQWLVPDRPSKLPHGPTHQLGVGVVLFHPQDPSQLLVLQEKTGPAAAVQLWKLPTGLVDPQEDIPNAAVRELLEETSLVGAFESILAYRQAHFAARSSDLFFLCHVTLQQASLDDPIVWTPQPEEIAEIRWMSVTEYTQQDRWKLSPAYQALNQTIVQQSMELQKRKKEDIGDDSGGRTTTTTTQAEILATPYPAGFTKGNNVIFEPRAVQRKQKDEDMSRFWAGASSSDSDSDASDSSSNYSEEDVKPTTANRWVDFSDSDSDDDEARVVKSGKERSLETFQKHISAIRAAMRERDFFQIQEEFDALSKAMIKAKKVLAEGIPRPLVRILVDLEDTYIPERLADKAAFKSLSARQGRALNRMKLALKKHNKPYQVVMDHYRKNPDPGDILDDDQDKDAGDDSDDDSDDDSSSSSSSSDSDDDSDKDSDDKNTVVAKKDKKKDKVQKVAVEKKDTTVISRDHDAIRAPKSVLPVEGLTAALVNRKVKEIASQRGRRGTDAKQMLRQLEGLSRLSMEFGPRVEIPILMYVVSAQFGLQRTIDDFMDTATWRSCASYLERISKVLVEDGYKLGVQTIDEADMVLGTAANAKKMKAAASGAQGAMAAVAAEQALINPHTGEPETEDERAERLRLEKENSMSAEELKTIPVVGSLSMYFGSLEAEFTKSLQKILPHSPDYVTRLRDEAKLVELLTAGQTYFSREGQTAEAAAMAQLRVEHLYYRHDSIAKQVDRATAFCNQFGDVSMLHPACVTDTVAPADSVCHPAAASGKPALPEDGAEAEANADLIQSLCAYVYENGTDLAKARATMCHVFYLALHDQFLEARDLLLMSHLQDAIYDLGDIPTMILFNRMMVTLGMCAFRHGRIIDAHQCLSEVCSGRVRELLAQGVNTGRFNDKTPEQEKAELRRQIPFHQHINLELLEACHLISAMLLEVPNMASASLNDNTRFRRPISRTFRKYNDMYEHQVFTGPPEQTRDFVMCASKNLRKGEWKTCVDLCTNLEVWNLFPGESSAESIKTMLAAKIKLEGLRTYLFAFSAQYESLSLSQLCAMFEMSKNEVHSVVSKMMINRELHASWDQPTETIVLRKVQPSNMQVMALQFADKAASLVEANERLLDAATGNHGYRDDWKNGDGDDRYGQRGGGGFNSASRNNRPFNRRDGGNSKGGRGGRGGRGRGGGRGGGGRGGPRRNNRRN
eukprot:Nitzschia sp. Nitz4//scaffold160_size51814//21287//25958//NITZ4_006910-RA/size51814-augustus-gene-0.70-mRNA-1//-1//CDS//3329537845//2267//frame0